MNLTNLIARVANETGLDATTDATVITAWINQAYQQLSGAFDWPWLLTNATMQTEADITTGTATVSAGATSVTLSTAPVNVWGSNISVATNYMIQFTGESDDWYLISAHTSGTTSVTIANNFVGTSNYTAGAYIIRRVFYTTPTGLDRIINMRQTITDVEIPAIDVRDYDRILPDPQNTGTPVYYYLTGMASSGLWQVGFDPVPSAVINIQVRGYRKITELSSGSDEPLIPVKWHNILVFMALALYGHEYIDDTRVQIARQRASELLREMEQNYSPTPDRMSVVQPWDQRVQRPPFGALRFPPNFPSSGWWVIALVVLCGL